MDISAQINEFLLVVRGECHTSYAQFIYEIVQHVELDQL